MEELLIVIGDLEIQRRKLIFEIEKIKKENEQLKAELQQNRDSVDSE